MINSSALAALLHKFAVAGGPVRRGRKRDQADHKVRPARGGGQVSRRMGEGAPSERSEDVVHIPREPPDAQDLNEGESMPLLGFIPDYIYIGYCVDQEVYDWLQSR
jgi:hypothetical protein